MYVGLPQRQSAMSAVTRRHSMTSELEKHKYFDLLNINVTTSFYARCSCETN